MNTDGIIKKAQEDFAKLSKMPVDGVIGLSKTEEGWVVLLEALERRAIPDTMDVLGMYEVRLDSEVTSSALTEKSCVSVAKPKKSEG